MKSRVIGLRLPLEDLEKVTEFSRIQNQIRNRVIIAAIREYIDRSEIEEPLAA